MYWVFLPCGPTSMWILRHVLTLRRAVHISKWCNFNQFCLACHSLVDPHLLHHNSRVFLLKVCEEWCCVMTLIFRRPRTSPTLDGRPSVCYALWRAATSNTTTYLAQQFPAQVIYGFVDFRKCGCSRWNFSNVSQRIVCVFDVFIRQNLEVCV